MYLYNKNMFSSIWYDSLTKPFLSPPKWVFAPVWTILYGTLLTALILYTIKISNKSKFSGYVLFLTHMIFNFLWSPVFFILHKIDIALYIIFIMDISVILLVKKFFSVSKIAGTILIPYLVWIFYATYLNFQYYNLN